MTDSDNGQQSDDAEVCRQRCPLVDPTDLVWLRPVLPGEPARIVAALRDAQVWAVRLRAELYRLEVITHDWQVEPHVNDEGRPAVRVTLTVAGARQLNRMLFDDVADHPNPTGKEPGDGSTHAA